MDSGWPLVSIKHCVQSNSKRRVLNEKTISLKLKYYVKNVVKRVQEFFRVIKTVQDKALKFVVRFFNETLNVEDLKLFQSNRKRNEQIFSKMCTRLK